MSRAPLVMVVDDSLTVRKITSRMLTREDLSPALVRAAILEILRDPGFRANARAIAGEIARMPPPAEAVRAIEALVTARAVVH